MKTAGIIAEFNPFHNGHAHLLREAKRLCGADYLIVLMSGEFVQRGIPAIAEKHVRVRDALAHGADLVLELPVYYSLGSAEYFARGAVSILDRLGVVDFLAFGSECGDLSALRAVAEAIGREPDAYRRKLRAQLKSGQSFPAARAQAAAAYMAQTQVDGVRTTQVQAGDARMTQVQAGGAQTAQVQADRARTAQADGASVAALLSLPNNILGVEYLSALQWRNSAIRPVTLPRMQGACFASAAEIRSALLQPLFSDATSSSSAEFSGAMLPDVMSSGAGLSGAMLPDVTPSGAAPFLAPCFPGCAMPPDVCQSLAAYTAKTGASLMHANRLSSFLQYKLLLERDQGYTAYADVHPALSHKISAALPSFTDFNAFSARLKSKELTYTRIQRALLHILLDIRRAYLEEYTANSPDWTAYARILGFRRDAAPLLHALKAHSALPLLSKLADAKRHLDALSLRLLQEDVRASAIYAMAAGLPVKSEYEKQIVRL